MVLCCTGNLPVVRSTRLFEHRKKELFNKTDLTVFEPVATLGAGLVRQVRKHANSVRTCLAVYLKHGLIFRAADLMCYDARHFLLSGRCFWAKIVDAGRTGAAH